MSFPKPSSKAEADEITKWFIETLRTFCISQGYAVTEVYESGNARPGDSAYVFDAADFNVEVFGPLSEKEESMPALDPAKLAEARADLLRIGESLDDTVQSLEGVVYRLGGSRGS